MLRRPPNSIWLLLSLTTVPFIYNSCQGGLFSQQGFSTAQSQCKSGLFKGQLQKLADLSAEDPFRARKVKLFSDESFSAQGKAGPSAKLDSGSRLGVVLDNSCLENGQGGPLSNELARGSKLNPLLDRQAYAWDLQRDMVESEIVDVADADPCVVGVSWNREYKTQAFNDPSLSVQSHLAALRAEESYAAFYGGGGSLNPTNGEPVIVAVIDSGVDWPHPDIYGNLQQHRDGIGIDITTVNGTISYDPSDVSPIGHGTHVTGLIAAVTNNSIGVAGAAPFRVKIMPIKVFARDASGDLSTTSTHLFNAMRTAHRSGAKVINLSLGSINFGPATDSVAESAVIEAVSNGATVVTVTGNAEGGASGADINGSTLTVIPGIYANRPGVIGVGSFDVASGNKSNFSHFSTTYGEIAAPGAENGLTGLYSTLPRTQNSYGRLAGTSQAAPLVSAAAALTVALIKGAYNNVPPTPEEVERLILESAVKDGKLAPYFKNGQRLDLLSLVRKINAEYPLTKASATPGSVNSLDLSSSACH